ETVLRQHRVSRLLIQDGRNVPKFDEGAKELVEWDRRYPGVNQSAVRALTDVGDLPADIVTRLVRLTDIPDPTLRRELASAAIRLGPDYGVKLVHALMAHKED